MCDLAMQSSKDQCLQALRFNSNSNIWTRGATVPGYESPKERTFQETTVPESENSRERKYQGAKVPPVVLSLPTVRGNESSSYRASNFRKKTCACMKVYVA